MPTAPVAAAPIYRPVGANPYDTSAPSQDQIDLQARNNALTGSQNTFNRSQQGLDFNQNLGEFGQFVNQYFPQTAGGGSSTTATSGMGSGQVTQVPGMGTVGTWTPTPPPQHITMASPGSTSGVAFARAKDQVGGSMQGLMKAMGDQFSTRGIGGSSVAANAVGNTLLGGEQQLGEVARDQAIADTNTANDFAKTSYQGQIDQRGQDITSQGQQEADLASQRAAGVAMRGQDISANTSSASLKQQADQNRMAVLTGLWSAFNKGSAGGVLY